jgi:lipopolysaccharide/colanic/teichoic acid biosynthesis glycosyltransferase
MAGRPGHVGGTEPLRPPLGDQDPHVCTWVRQAVGGRPLRHLAAKRGLDVLVAGLVLLLLLAPLLLAIALAVKFTSRGPVVLRQERIGLDGRPFMLLRFRTMYADKRLDALRAQRLNIAQDQRPSRGLVPKRRRNRVTRVGRVLHRYSLNVLPQLINVLTRRFAPFG